MLVLVQGSVDIRKTGWLDRLVEYHRHHFIQDLQKIPDVQLKAKVANAPPGYLDSEDWDYSSVLRLLSLIRQSEGLGPVRRVLRHALQATRRMSIKESLKLFPSLQKEIPNDLYYDIEETVEYYDDVKTPKYSENKTLENAIIVVSNPVEARLPSAMISVHLLKEILENRAKAARYMPKTKMTFIWKAKNNTRLSSSAPQDATTLGDSASVTGIHGSGNSSVDTTTVE
ncbi:uncharacterized protein LOC125055316 isoform X1 [Pieris napi]|uniref:uncharacterized protein LOC125055316 isoform X1 n=1 Tax=Pieris napi TaxID=78633 RepID=UPI001FB9F31B|nr:uncharacterized protein LOC125055316 isoform X1 [Pieris napi]